MGRCNNCGDWVDGSSGSCSTECSKEMYEEIERKKHELESFVEDALAGPPQAKLVIFEDGE